MILDYDLYKDYKDVKNLSPHCETHKVRVMSYFILVHLYP